MARLIEFEDGKFGIRRMSIFGYQYFNFHMLPSEDPWRFRLGNPHFDMCKVDTPELAKRSYRQYKDRDRKNRVKKTHRIRKEDL